MSYIEQSHPVWNLISSVVADEGFCLYDAELLNASSLRISIAAQSKEDTEISREEDSLNSKTQGGVSVGDCSRVLRRLMVVFLAEGEKYGIHPEPEIDVSSPGINRSLRLPEHFSTAIGERVKVILRPSCEVELGESGKRSGAVLGALESFSEGVLTVVEEQSSLRCRFPLEDVKRASVEFLF